MLALYDDVAFYDERMMMKLYDDWQDTNLLSHTGFIRPWRCVHWKLRRFHCLVMAGDSTWDNTVTSVQGLPFVHFSDQPAFVYFSNQPEPLLSSPTKSHKTPNVSHRKCLRCAEKWRVEGPASEESSAGAGWGRPSTTPPTGLASARAFV